MSSPHLICGIDIGNTAIKVAVAKMPPHGTVPEIIGIGTSPSASGLRAGEIVDMKETIENLRAALASAASMSGASIRRAYVSVSGLHIGTQLSRGTIAVARGDGEITASDIERVISTAQVVSMPPNREIIHVIPRGFVIDGSEEVRDPLGMKGVRLEADVLLVHGLSRHLKNLSKCVNECGIEVAGFVFAPLAGSLAALDKHQKEFGVAHVDFGGGTASLTVWEQGDLLHSAIMRIGSRHITNDLAIRLRTSLENAERIKIDIGAVNEAIDRRKKPEMVDLTAYVDEPYVTSRRELLNVIDARVRELLDMVVVELKKAGKHGLLPAGVVVSGGGAKLPGLGLLVREELGLPVRQFRPMDVEAFDAAMDPAFSTSLGLVVWGAFREVGGQHGAGQPSAISDAFGRAFGWLKAFLP